MELERKLCKVCHEDITKEYASSIDGVVSCPYCGSTFAIPKRDLSKEVLNLLSIGEMNLSLLKFDEAKEAFLNANKKDDKEPEIYFNLALATNKIHFIKDEVNNRLQPILRDINIEFLKDKNYLKALELASEKQKEQYEGLAKEIEEVKKEFNRLNKEHIKYDTFICLKVSDESNEKTSDYFTATDIYYDLMDKGLNPFLSEKSLKDKTGSDYEAHILYALSTAKTLLVVCDNKDYLETKWVKNEYKRFYDMLSESEKEKDCIAIIYKNEKINTLPSIKGTFSSIDYSKPNASEKIYEFVTQFDKGVALSRKQKEEQEMKELLLEQEKKSKQLLEDAKREIERLKKLSDEDLKEQFYLEQKTRTDYYYNKKINFLSIKGPIDNEKIAYVVPDGVLVNCVEEIGESAFKNCDSLVAVHLNDNLLEIRHDAFLNCKNLMYVNIPRGVWHLDPDAFEGCTKLRNINISPSNEKFSFQKGCIIRIKKYLTKVQFADDKCLVIPDGIEVIEGSAIKGLDNIEKIIISDSVKSLEYCAIKDCKNLKEIYIGKGLEKLTSREIDKEDIIYFENCPNLKKIEVSKDNNHFVSINDCLYTKDNKLVGVPNGLKEINIVDGTKEVGNYVFCTNESIQKFNFPSTLEKLGCVFFGCKCITHIDVPPNIKVLPKDFAAGCVSLETINFADVEEIGESAFAGCTKLENIVLPNTIKKIQRFAFANSGLKKIIIGKNVIKMGTWVFINCDKLDTIYVRRGRPLFYFKKYEGHVVVNKGWDKQWHKKSNNNTLKYHKVKWRYKGD